MNEHAGSIRTARPFHEGWVFVPDAVPADAPWEALAEAGEPIDLPHTWNAVDGQDGGNDYRRGTSTYAVRLPAPDADGDVWLEFRGVNSSAQIHLNGTLLATHEGGYSTFRVPLAEALRDDNVLVVHVDNGPNETVYPQRADFTFYGGIYRDVLLLTVPAAHVRLDDHGGPGFTATPLLDGEQATVALHAEVTGGDAVRFVIDGEGEVLVPVREGTADAELTIAQVRRWHGRRDPHLYTATAELLQDGKPVDAVSIRFGCREFAVDPDRGFLLNGEEYPLRGVSRHQDWEGVGNVLTPAMMERDIALMEELGATTVRLAHYQHDQAFYDLCDEAGIVVWAEIPQITNFLPAGTVNATAQLTELIVQNRHHASIMSWGLSNEITIGGNSEALLDAHRALNDLAHRLDPTRLTAMAHAFVLDAGDPLVAVPDVNSFNLYYGWYLGDLEDNDRWFADFRAAHPGVAIGLSEYGADANPRYQGANPTRGDYSEQYQARYHEHLIDLIEASPYLWATHVWNLADFAADGREEGGLPGRNQKGLVTFDRSLKKDAFYAYKAAWSPEPFVHVCGRRYVDRAEAVTEVTVYSSQEEVELWCDDVLVESLRGVRVFRFSVPLTGEHRLTARSGALTDTIDVRRASAPNPDYAMPNAQLVNWFDADVPSPEGFYSIHDSLADIKRTAAGGALIERLMDQAKASVGDVARDVQMPPAMQAMIDRMTVAALLRHSGDGIPAEQVIALNEALNEIPKQA